MLLSLGLFAFGTDSAGYQQLSRKTDWRHEDSPRFGARPAVQFCGPGKDDITLSGVILPGVSGRHEAMRTLRDLGDQGEAWPLVDALGRVHGDFIIASIDEGQSVFLDNGVARRADFTVELRRVS
ncbi:phage tail protein [Novosphingopyxis sp. YJ-S2-01]|uniref:phage tail protein n=1 Tax=Novosphingopyxis sp. YJ-S2-01 TaxID=2794021 RepID=UPI0018DC9978|nr:phage tail protein [Novosphingopyxis sp. YJ-S2-01]MBH9536917.1 phage tail protein [Novosphingopyxis sp. YJ-S2-01]